MPNEHVCLSTLRGISAQAAAIIDRYAREQSMMVPVAAFQQFMHTLHWGDFAELDLSLLDGFVADDRGVLIDELRAYHAYLCRQRERVHRFHRAYHAWLDKRHSELPPAYRERLRSFRQRYGLYDYFRITGLSTNSGMQRFLADPERCMHLFEQAFADLEEQQRRERREQEEANWWSHMNSDTARGYQGNGYAPSQVEEALRLLGLVPGATLADIQRAYRTQAKAVHPDRQGAGSTEQMAALNRAYAYLRRCYRQSAPEMRRAEK